MFTVWIASAIVLGIERGAEALEGGLRIVRG
jgi:hypothetical protein